MRIIRLANFVAPHSGGLRTSLAELGAGYLAAGHEPVLVIPGDRDDDERCAQGRVITLRAPRVPFTGGYRVLWRRRRLARLLAALRPDALEVSDRTTLRWTGAWAREHGVPAVMVSHESVTALLKLTRLGPGRLRSALSRSVADWLNRRTARAYHRIICTTGWAAAEFGRIDAGNVVRVPLGVDLDTFSPRVRRVRTQYAGEGQILLVHCGRLSAEKRPQRSLTTLASLRAAGLPVRLVVAGDGPLRARLVRRATRTGLPVTFAGFLSGRADLAALEALACGTPVVVSAESALPEVVGDAGASVPGEDLAAGVLAVLARPERSRRAAARARAEQYDWGTAARGFLAAHGPRIARPKGGDPHDAVRGAGRLDHGGHGRPGTRTGVGRAAGQHAAPARAAQPGHAGRAGRRRGARSAACRHGPAAGRGQRRGRHQRHAPRRFRSRTDRPVCRPHSGCATCGRRRGAHRTAAGPGADVRAAGCAGASASPPDARGQRGGGRGGAAVRTVHLDVARDPATYERRYWSVDRLHPNERGHRLIACRFHALLDASEFPVGPGPDPEPSSPPPNRLAEVHWMATKSTAWLVRRSRDLVPDLVGLAVREWLGLGREEPEPETTEPSEITEPKYPEPESTEPEDMALEPVNLNVLSKPSGNLRLYEC